MESCWIMVGATMNAKVLLRRGDERKGRRRPMRRAALVLHANGQAAPCVIWDMSAGGARIAIAHPTDAPLWFTLVLTKDGGDRRYCEVVWMDARYVGVKFVAAPSFLKNVVR
jgi:PilZ domain